MERMEWRQAGQLVGLHLISPWCKSWVVDGGEACINASVVCIL